MDGYLVGRMPPPWVEWNDQYRDTIRDFWRGLLRHPDGRHAARRLVGLYADDGRLAYNSVNFVTAHDGFTLRDLVSQHEAQRGQRREQPRRHGQQPSWNHGIEGESDDEAIVDSAGGRPPT